MRTCIGCRRRAPVSELVRVVAGPEGSLEVSRSLGGRGAWLCAGSLDCVRSAARRNAFPRALRVSVPPTAVSALETLLEPESRG